MENFRDRLLNFILKRLSMDENYYYWRGIKERDKLLIHKGNKKIFFLMTPTYGNLGDQAIEYATEQFIKNYFQEYTLIKIHLQDTYYSMASIEKALEDGDIVLLQGGGNFGNLYLDIEKKRRFIVSHLKGKPVISMPSSVMYENTSAGKAELKKSIDIYSRNETFVITTRDDYSHYFCSNQFPDNKTIKCPDMVFYLSQEGKNVNRCLSLVCMRMDKEGINNDIRSELINELSCRLDNAIIYDTRVEREIRDEIKESEVKSILTLFSHCKIVITDRLHAMIFSAITGTPCIVLPSLDTKIEGAYKWIESLNYIRLIKNPTVEAVCKEAENLWEKNEECWKSLQLDNEFKNLATNIKNMVYDVERF